MDKRFERALGKTLSAEGYISDDPDDHGGFTKWGVTGRAAKTAGYDVMTLTKPEMMDVYYRFYYSNYKIQDITNAEAHDFAFDWCVHAGPRSIKLWQQIFGLTADGDIGPKTCRALRDAGNRSLPMMQGARIADLVALCNRDKTQFKFLTGWGSRVFHERWNFIR